MRERRRNEMKKRLSALVFVLVASLWTGNGYGVAVSEVMPVEGGCTCVQSKLVCDNMSGKRVCWSECTAWQCDM